MIADTVIGLAVAVLGTAIGALPGAAFTVEWDPPAAITGAATFVGSLNRYVPILEMTTVIVAAGVIRGATTALWLFGWVYARLPFKGT